MSIETIKNHSYFCPCPRGLEIALAEELNEIAQLAAPAVTLKVHTQVPGGVHCSGPLTDAYRINLHSRIASRVLLRLAHGSYKNENDIYDMALAQSWEDWFQVSHTIRVDVTAVKSPLRSLEFTTLKIKDAICDRFRDLCNERPSVDTRTPDMRIVGFLDAHNFTLYLDTSGEALFKRGWRDETGEAPAPSCSIRCAGPVPSWPKPRRSWPASRPAHSAASALKNSTTSSRPNGRRSRPT
jgi:putative N6-adenine-specific DNA methylase